MCKYHFFASAIKADKINLFSLLSLNRIQMNGNSSFEKSHNTPSKDLKETSEVPASRRLRSVKSDDMVEIMSSMSSCSDSTNKASSFCSSSDKFIKSAIPYNIEATKSTKEILSDIFQWKLLSNYNETTPSMIYGVMHLTRLIVKLPEFLDVTTSMSDSKLQVLLTFLDNVCEFLETCEVLYQNIPYSKVNVPYKSPTKEIQDNERTPPRKRVARDKQIYLKFCATKSVDMNCKE